MECANKRKMSVGSWPYWREVGKRSWSDTLDIARFLFEFISEGKSFASSTASARRWNQVEKKARNGGGKKKIKIKNNFEIGSKRILNFTIACATVSFTQVVVA